MAPAHFEVKTMDRPKIRKVFPTNTEKDAEKPFYFADPFDLTTGRFEVTEKELDLARLMNGNRTHAEIAKAYRDAHGDEAALAEVAELVTRMGAGLFLDEPRFRKAYDEAQDAFRAVPVRPMGHSGECYSEDPAVFEKDLEGWLAPPGGPGPLDFSTPGPRVPALFAPHIDISISGNTYASAYKPGAEDTANDLFVILGTAHYRDVNPFILTEKPFATPWGTVEVDREFTADLKKAFGADLFRDELIQKAEHSVEFQAVFLDALLHGRRPYKIVPILVSSFAGLVDEGASPASNPLVSDFLAALEETLDPRRERSCVVAGVDLAHVGLKFGDSFKPDERTLDDLHDADRRSLDYCCDFDAEGFWNDVMADGNARKVCGVAPMYVASRLIRDARGEVVSYGRDYHPDEGFVVTYAGVVFKCTASVIRRGL